MRHSSPRLHRVPPERSGPIRNPLVRGNSSTPFPRGTLRDVVECGVQTAYSVIDEYMRRGYQAAHHNERNGNSKGHMSNERSNYGWSNPWGPMTPLMEQWMAAFRMWTDAWSAFGPGMRPPFPSQPWPYPPTGAAPSTVSVSVSSHRPIEVTVDLLPGAELKDLQADSFEPPFQSSVYIYPRPGGIYVRVDVPQDQAAGTYHGVIRSNGCVVGNLTVTITQPSKKSS
jgi:hypothetical protein